MKLVVQVNDLLSKRMARLMDRQRDTTGLRQAIGQVFVAGSKRRFAQGGDPPGSWPASRRGGQTLVDKGKLRKSVTFRLVGDSSVEVGSNLRQANILHAGGTIKPVNAKALAIPMPGIKGRPRDFRDTWIMRLSAEQRGEGKGLAMIWQRQSDGKERVLFLLVKSVTIPARPFVGYGTYEQRRVRTVAGKWFTGGEVN